MLQQGTGPNMPESFIQWHMLEALDSVDAYNVARG